MSNELAEQFFKSAEEYIKTSEDQEGFIAILNQVENLFPEDVAILCRSARLLFRYGVLNSKRQFYLLALDKLKLAKEKNPIFFERSFLWLHLWGNILIEIGKLLNKCSFFYLALEKYEQAEQISDSSNAELFWDLGEVWLLLGQASGEPSDFQKGLKYFHLAQSCNLNAPFFLLDYGTALCLFGKMNGNPIFIEKAITLYHRVLTDTYSQGPEPLVAYVVGWRKLALAMKLRFELTHLKQHLLEADTTFRNAILSDPKNRELWIDWVTLFLTAGWLYKDLQLVEEGFEKLTSSKIRECNPLKATYLLSIGLTTFGLLLENLTLLQDSQERIHATLENERNNPHLRFASIFVQLGFGIYFSDEKVFMRIATLLEQEICNDTGVKLESLHALFQTYMAWGMKCKNILLIQKGIFAISRLSELRPFSPVYLNEWGVALLHLTKLDSELESSQAYVEEAICKFKKAAHLFEDATTLYNLGCALIVLGNLTQDEENYEQAINFLTKASKVNPSNTHIFYHLGLAFYHLGKLTSEVSYLSQAIELLDALTKLDRENENIFCYLGHAYLMISEILSDAPLLEERDQKRNKAEKALIRAAQLGSEHAFYYLACLYSLSKLYDSSLCFLKKAQQVNCLLTIQNLEQDKWLENVRATEAFQIFLKKMQDENG